MKEENIKGKWYAIIYIAKKGPHTSVARLHKKFRADFDGIVKAIRCVCLKEKLGFSDIVFEEEANPRSEIIVVSDVMIGTIKTEMTAKNGTYLTTGKLKNTLKLPASWIKYLAKNVTFVTTRETVSITN